MKTAFVSTLLLAVLILTAAGLLGCNGTALPGPTPTPSRQIQQLKTPLATPTPSEAVFTTYSLPSANTYLGAITSGPDNNLWVTEGDANKIAQVTLAGSITEFPVPTAGAYPALMTVGPDGNLWFTEYGANNIARITTAGAITEFPYAAPPGAVAGDSNAQGIAVGSDGNLWFAYSGYSPACGGDNASAIEVMSTSGNIIATYSTPTANAGPDLVVAGPDGNVWFAESDANNIARITPSGTITEFKIPTSPPPYCAGSVGGIAVGPDGNIWFTERWTEKVGRITTAGTITEFGPYAAGDYRFQRIIAGPDGNMWFAEEPTSPGVGIIAKMDTSGNLLADYTWSNGGPRALAVGADSNIWYTDESLDQVGKLTPVAKAKVMYSKKLIRMSP